MVAKIHPKALGFATNQRREAMICGLAKAAAPIDQALQMLSDGYVSVSDVPGDWYLVACRSHHEKAIAGELAEEGFDFYLPLTQVRKVTKCRHRVTLRIPLFDGYLFAAAPREGDGVTNNIRLCDFLYGHQHVFTDEYWGRIQNRRQIVADLSIVEMALKHDPALQVVTIRSKGQKVIVTRGPWLGYEGEVDGFGDGTRAERVYIAVKTLGQCIVLDIDRSDLALAE